MVWRHTAATGETIDSDDPAPPARPPFVEPWRPRRPRVGEIVWITGNFQGRYLGEAQSIAGRPRRRPSDWGVAGLDAHREFRLTHLEGILLAPIRVAAPDAVARAAGGMIRFPSAAVYVRPQPTPEDAADEDESNWCRLDFSELYILPGFTSHHTGEVGRCSNGELHGRITGLLHFDPPPPSPGFARPTDDADATERRSATTETPPRLPHEAILPAVRPRHGCLWLLIRLLALLFLLALLLAFLSQLRACSSPDELEVPSNSVDIVVSEPEVLPSPTLDLKSQDTRATQETMPIAEAAAPVWTSDEVESTPTDPDVLHLQVPGPLNFKTNKYELTADSLPTIIKLGETIRKHPGSVVLIEGHTDNVGSSSTNKQISFARASAVRDALIFAGDVPEGQLVAVGLGEDYPIASNSTESGRKENRRVVFVVNNEGTTTPAPAP